MSAWPPPPLDPSDPLHPRPRRRSSPRLNAHGEPERLPGYVPYLLVINLVLAAGIGILHVFG